LLVDNYIVIAGVIFAAIEIIANIYWSFWTFLHTK